MSIVVFTFIHILLLFSSLIKGSTFLCSYYLLSMIVFALYKLNIWNLLLLWSIISIFINITYVYIVNSNEFEHKNLPIIHTISQFLYFLYVLWCSSSNHGMFISILTTMTTIILVCVCILSIILILLQRGEEGVFARDNMLSNQFASEDATMVRSTVVFGSLYVILNLLLSILIFTSKIKI